MIRRQFLQLLAAFFIACAAGLWEVFGDGEDEPKIPSDCEFVSVYDSRGNLLGSGRTMEELQNSMNMNHAHYWRLNFKEFFE